MLAAGTPPAPVAPALLTQIPYQRVIPVPAVPAVPAVVQEPEVKTTPDSPPTRVIAAVNLFVERVEPSTCSSNWSTRRRS